MNTAFLRCVASGYCDERAGIKIYCTVLEKYWTVWFKSYSILKMSGIDGSFILYNNVQYRMKSLDIKPFYWVSHHVGVPNCGKTVFNGRGTVPIRWCGNENALYSVSKNVFPQFGTPPPSPYEAIEVFMWRHIKPSLQVIHTRDHHDGFLLPWNGIGKHTKCLVTFYLVHYTISFNRVTRILEHILGGNLKLFCEVNQKFQRFLLFFSILRHTKGNQAAGPNLARIGVYCVVQTLDREIAQTRIHHTSYI